ncbi:MAG: PEP-CTERM sorting domain-containing protein [Planctomycetota bacterium]
MTGLSAFAQPDTSEFLDSPAELGFIPGSANSTYAQWDVFGVAFFDPAPVGIAYSPNDSSDSISQVPDAPGDPVDAGSLSTVIQNTSGAILTSGGNIYSFSSVVDFDIAVFNADADGTPIDFTPDVDTVTRIVMQTQTLGNVPDFDSITLDIKDAQGEIIVAEIAPDEAGILGTGSTGSPFGGILLNYAAVWDVVGIPDAEYNINFTAAGTSLSLDRLRVDTFVSPTALSDVGINFQAIPEPTSAAALGLGLFLLGSRRRLSRAGVR